VRATKLVVRPGRKNGGTTLVFAVRRPSVVRFTVVRVYPTCERVGSFTVRARQGTNRVRFKGRVNGRPLPDGVYRVLAQVRGHEKAVASVTLVVARRKAIEKNLRRPRSTACSANDADAIAAAIGAAPPAEENGGKSRVASAVDPVVGAVKGVERTASKIAQAARTVPDRIRDFAGGQSDKIKLTLIGLGLLAIALVGALVTLNIVRFGYRYRVFR
jgi:hypothetical protein